MAQLAPLYALKGMLKELHTLSVFVLILLLTSTGVAQSDPLLFDWRLNAPLSNSGKNEAVLRVSDCNQLKQLSIGVPGSEESLTPVDGNQVALNSKACEFSVPVDKANRQNRQGLKSTGNRQGQAPKKKALSTIEVNRI